jgi:hypothetical protein
MRVAIVGVPRGGKTTLAKAMGGRVWHADDLRGLPWSDQSEQVALWLDVPGPWVMEGMAVIRGLRKWRSRHPGQAPPVDKVIVLGTSKVAQSPGQQSMGLGAMGMIEELRDWFGDRMERR